MALRPESAALTRSICRFLRSLRRTLRLAGRQLLHFQQRRWDACCGHHLQYWLVRSKAVLGHVSAKLLLESQLDERIGTSSHSFSHTCLSTNCIQLDPYFSRIRYNKEQKKKWFHEREGVLYGFAVAFFIMVKIPLVGVLVYGIAEASTAFLITKITEPPPPPSDAEEFKQKDIHWENKNKFLDLPLDKLDKLNISTKYREKLRPDAISDQSTGRAFT
jgi:hypothetical protein